MSAAAKSLLLVGCGKMGGALLSGWLDRAGTVDAVTVVEPGEAAAAFRGRPGVRVVAGRLGQDAPDGIHVQRRIPLQHQCP